MSDIKLSIVIPTYNEEDRLEKLLKQLRDINLSKELIIVDGGSNDRTVEIGRQYNAQLLSTAKGRGLQLAKGARAASGEFLLFLHADVYFKSSPNSILQILVESQVAMASFKLEFDPSNWFLKLNSFFSSFAYPFFYFGDQGLWISKDLYQKADGFNKEYQFLEDQDLYKRAFQYSRGVKIQATLIASARKYHSFGIYRLQFFYYKLWLAYTMGVPRSRLEKMYKKFFN